MNKDVRQIEHMGASINIYLKNGVTGEWSKFWMIRIETCKRESDPNNECIWCSKQNLEWIDGHPNGWLEGATTPDLKPYRWEEDIEVLNRQNLKRRMKKRMSL